MGDEADWLNNDMGPMADDHDREMREEEYFNEVSAMKARYNDCKNAETGATIICPTCKKRIVKRTYNKIFCKNKCKDIFWNNTSNKRRKRAQDFNR